MRALLMGGQACVLYGAAEFSRDTDLAILASPGNLARLQEALRDLRAHVIAVPPFEARYLRRGHAVQFRCEDPEAEGMRVDVMTRMRGVAAFPLLWSRRASFELGDGTRLDVMSVSDLVQAKKTQRDKDWPMIRRLVEAHYFQHRERPTTAQVRFWLRELRSPELLLEVARRWPEARAAQRRRRPLLDLVRPGNEERLTEALLGEEWAERRTDAVYWKPLKAELEKLRHARVQGGRREADPGPPTKTPADRSVGPPPGPRAQTDRRAGLRPRGRPSRPGSRRGR